MRNALIGHPTPGNTAHVALAMKQISRAAGAAKRAMSGASREPFLTLDEAAEILRLHPRTVRDYVSRGELRGRLIGRRWRFRQKDLDAFFDSARSQWDFTVGKGGDEE